MKNGFKMIKIFIACMIGSMLISHAGYVLAGTDTRMTVVLRIEGMSENIFYDELDVPYDGELTAAEVLAFADDMSDQLSVTGEDTGFITDINSEVSGTFGGWDGWLFTVNDTSPSVGIDSYIMEEGDVLLVYDGDPFGVGMQFPAADLSGLEDGRIRFTSSDTTYDTDFNPTVTDNP